MAFKRNLTQKTHDFDINVKKLKQFFIANKIKEESIKRIVLLKRICTLKELALP